MSDAEWEEAYRAACLTFYAPDHVHTILRRSAACKLGRPNTTLSTILWFYLMIIFENVHLLEDGAFRLEFRRDRRYGLKRDSPFVFYPRFGFESVRKLWGYWRIYKQFKAMLDEVLTSVTQTK